MLSRIRSAFFLLLLAAWLPALAGDAGEVAVPTLSQRVTDLTGTLGPDQKAALETRLAQVEQQQGSQIAVLIVPTTQPEAIEQYLIRVVDQWKLGRKDVDDGILILIAKDDRKMRIEVGYGLEGAIPDAIAKRIVSDVIAPYFRQGDFYGGISAAVERLARIIAGEPLPEPQAQGGESAPWEQFFPFILFGGLIAGAILRAIFGNFLGGVANGGLVGFLIWVLGGGVLIALILAFLAFVITLSGVANHLGRGGFGSGGIGGGGFGSGTFSGGGGGFGGGGASGSW